MDRRSGNSLEAVRSDRLVAVTGRFSGTSGTNLLSTKCYRCTCGSGCVECERSEAVRSSSAADGGSSSDKDPAEDTARSFLVVLIPHHSFDLRFSSIKSSFSNQRRSASKGSTGRQHLRCIFSSSSASRCGQHVLADGRRCARAVQQQAAG